MSDQSPLSPEARAQHIEEHPEDVPLDHGKPESEASWFAHLRPHEQTIELLRRVGVGVYNDGFIHAGNFAYLSLVALFAFCIVAATIAGALGQTQSGEELIAYIFETVPPSAANALREPIESAMNSRSGMLLWLSAGVGLWTTASLIEAFREVLHRAYGSDEQRGFLQYRLGSLVSIIGGVIVIMLAFSAQVIIVSIEDVLYRYFPAVQGAGDYFAWGKIIPFVGLFLAIYVVFRGLTPRKYRARTYPKWPGAALVSLWWPCAIQISATEPNSQATIN